MKKGLTSLSDDLEETVKGINDFIKSLNKALKDLKDVSIEPELQTVSTSSKKVVGASTGQAKTAAASTLFNLLSGSTTAPQAPPVATASASPTVGSPPASPSAGPPKRPTSSNIMKPKRSHLPRVPLPLSIFLYLSEYNMLRVLENTAAAVTGIVPYMPVRTIN